MSSSPVPENEAAINELYRGSLDTFVSRRDALTKELRSAGDREAASMVKALRKPSRAAWALNLRVLQKPDAMSGLDATIREAVATSPPGDGGRAIIASLRVAIREFVIDSAKFAEDIGVAVDVDDLVGALTAVLGRAESFEALRRARLTDVPEAGGLDLLALLPPQNRREPAPASRPAKASSTQSDEPKARRDSREDAGRAATRAAAKEAASRLASAQKRAGGARKALEEAEAKVKVAETRLREAEEEARRARALRDAAREDVDSADAAVQSAEEALHRIEPGSDSP